MNFLTYIFYLNTLKGRGGETEFLNGPKVRPVTGKLLIFPASWDCVHRGVSPVSETKYIATGWVCNVPKSDPVIPQKVDFSDAFYLQGNNPQHFYIFCIESPRMDLKVKVHWFQKMRLRRVGISATDANIRMVICVKNVDVICR